MFSVKIIFGSTHDKTMDNQHIEDLAGQIKESSLASSEDCGGKCTEKRKKGK